MESHPATKKIKLGWQAFSCRQLVTSIFCHQIREHSCPDMGAVVLLPHQFLKIRVLSIFLLRIDAGVKL